MLSCRESEMRTSNFILWFVIVALGAGDAYLWYRLQRAEQSASAVQAQLDHVSQARPASFRQNARRTPLSHPQPAPLAAPIDPHNDAEFDEMSILSDRSRALLKDKRYHDAYLAFQRLLVEEMNPGMIAALHLDPQQADGLLDLLANAQMLESEVLGESHGGAEQRRGLDRLHQKLESDIAALLGAQKLREWQQYRKTMPAREEVARLAADLALTSNPLRKDQIDSLVQDFTTERERHEVDRGALYARIKDWSADTPVWQRRAHLEARQRLIVGHLDRMQDIGRAYLNVAQQQQLNAQLKRKRDLANAELEMSRVEDDPMPN